MTDAEKDYGRLSLLQLAEAICRENDPRALQELHDNRTPFRNAQGPMRLVDYIDGLRRKELERKNTPKGHDLVANGAYDMTVDKFGNLPVEGKNEDGAEEVKHSGPDCRYYYRAFLIAAGRAVRRLERDSAMEEENVAASVLQSFVRRHFELSLKECQRKSYVTRTRYVWKVDRGTITVWMPREMSGKKKWLEEHVDDPDPDRPGEKERVQAIVDEHFPPTGILPLSGFPRPLSAGHGRGNDEPPAGLEETTPLKLAEVVAEEKAENIDQQRRAIRQLGREALQELVIRIFDDLSHEDYTLSHVAKRFGVSKSTLSRFAGANWSGGEKEEARRPVPDLWQNTAEVLASVPVFKDAVREAGVWLEIKHATGESSPGKENK